jgi:hypothetical protein
MKIAFLGRRSGVAWAAALFAIHAGCGSGSSGGGTGGTGGTNAGGEASCAAAYDEAIAQCATPGLPAGVPAHQRERFIAACAVQLALPGSGVTAAALQACADAIAAEGAAFCKGQVAGPAACDFTRGSLPAGAVCQEGTQCQSAECIFSNDAAIQTGCGECSPTLALGDSCTSAPGACAAGTVCSTAAPNTCQPLTTGDVGAACREAAQCKSGLVCDFVANQCATPGAVGAPCNYAGTCATGLICSSMTRTCQTPAPSGAACGTTSDCAPQLGCGQTTQTCGAISWAQAGEACGDRVHCVLGGCPSAPNATCPAVIPDGQPCGVVANTTCDDQATCSGGVCTIEGAATCM